MSIDKKIDALIASLDANTESNNALAKAMAAGGSAPANEAATTEKKAAPKKEATVKKKPAEKKKAAPKAMDQKTFLTHLGTFLRSLQGEDEDALKEAKATLNEIADHFGAEKPSEVQPQDYHAYLEQFEFVKKGETPPVLASDEDDSDDDLLDL